MTSNTYTAANGLMPKQHHILVHIMVIESPLSSMSKEQNSLHTLIAHKCQEVVFRLLTWLAKFPWMDGWMGKDPFYASFLALKVVDNCWLSVHCFFSCFSCGLVSAPCSLVGLTVYLTQLINMLVSKFIENIQNLVCIEFLQQTKISSRHWLIF